MTRQIRQISTRGVRVTALIAALLATLLLTPQLQSEMAAAAQRPPVPAAKPKPTPKAASPIYWNLMPFGDSITLGHGGDDNGDGVTDWNGYRNRLRDKLVPVFGSAGRTVNMVGNCPIPDPSWKCNGTPTMGDWNHEGHSGWRTDQLLAYARVWAASHQPSAVLLMAGANDIGQNFDLANYGERMAEIVRELQAGRPGVHVFVATMTQFRDQRTSVTTLNNDLIANLASFDTDYVHLVPMHIVGREPAVELADHVHPNACGYERMAYVWYLYMRDALSSGWWPTGVNPFYSKTGVCP